MGWLISYDLTKKEQIAELVAGWSNELGGCRFLAHSVRGNTLYAVAQPFQRDTPERFEDRFILVCLLRKDRNMGWGYKDMAEESGPGVADCPLKFLKMAPVACQSWRDRVLAHHENRRNRSKVKIDVGTVFTFAPGFTAAGESLNNSQGEIVRKHGRGYIAKLGYSTIKVTRRHIGEVILNG